MGQDSCVGPFLSSELPREAGSWETPGLLPGMKLMLFI